jgi:hypothetical protein
MWRGRKAKVLRLRPSLSLSLGGGEIRHGVSEADVEAIPTKPKPSSQKGRAKATRQGDTGGSH